MKSIWTIEQIEFLKNNYEKLKTPELLKFLTDKNNDQIRWKAKQFNLTKKISRTKTNAYFLEDFNNPESCYWWGFITADGCINNKQLILSVHERDADHLKLFSNKCNSNIKYVTRINHWSKKSYTMARTVINDKFLLTRLKNKLKILPRKTYNPFDISIFLTYENLYFYLTGLIDGDGCICHNKYSRSIKIKLHPSWTNNYINISNKLKEFYDITSYVRIDKNGWLIFSIYKIKDIEKILNTVKDTIPILKRKWFK
jgi:hypothetical protein